MQAAPFPQSGGTLEDALARRELCSHTAPDTIARHTFVATLVPNALSSWQCWFQTLFSSHVFDDAGVQAWWLIQSTPAHGNVGSKRSHSLFMAVLVPNALLIYVPCLQIQTIKQKVTQEVTLKVTQTTLKVFVRHGDPPSRLKICIPHVP